MKRVLGTLLICVLTLIGTVGCQKGEKAVTVLRLGLEHEATHPYGQAMEEFAKRVKERTNGQVEIQIFPSSQLGSAPEMIEGMRMGSVDLVLTAIGYYKAYFPAIEATNVPFLITSEEQLMKILDGRVGQTLAEKMAENGYINLAYYWGGARHFTSNRGPINSVADMKGLKIRSITAKPVLIAFEAFGALPTPIAFSELYGALQTGVVEAQENPLAQIYNSGFYDVQKYLSLSGHLVTALNLAISQTAWNKLSPEQRRAIQESTAEVVKWNSENLAKAEAQLLQKLQEKGMIVNTVQDVASFQRVVEDLFPKFKEAIGSPDLDWLLEECLRARK